MFYVILCFFYHEYKKKNCQPLCIFVLFNTLQEGNTEDLFCWVYFLGFVVNVWWGPNSTGATPFVFCVFLCFSSATKGQMNRATPFVFCVFLCFSSASKGINEQVMCFVCFCVFPSDQWTHNQRAPCVFVFTYTLVIIPTRGKHLMCFVCFCVFYQRLVWSYFRPGKPPNVFYVFLCFSTKVSSHTTHVFRVFLYFINNI